MKHQKISALLGLSNFPDTNIKPSHLQAGRRYKFSNEGVILRRSLQGLERSPLITI
ncbi:MAG: hypothetical protein HXY43_07255 [Fischerella sp.]|uniref:hypothetical protein n=1 Tax=Fischerella sp. TaxID=1191 RepID=UPI00178ECA82|nr:hypothetical protein [Fischerella sp.]NWF59095.1 hypothetical protein [Fischerella sp.]